MTTRHLGFCPICEGTFKVQEGVLVHHGYKRPGDGVIHGDCFAVGYQSYELSCDVVRKYLPIVQTSLSNSEKALARFQSGEVETLTVINLVSKTTATLRKGEPRFERELQSRIRNTEFEIRMLKSEVLRLEKLIVDWAPRSLTTVEEAEAVSRAVQDSKRAEKASLKAQKLAEKEANLARRLESRTKKLQEGVDKAMKAKNLAKLADLFQDITWYTYRELLGKNTTEAQALAHIDRNHVWEKLGLIDASGNPLDNPARWTIIESLKSFNAKWPF